MGKTQQLGMYPNIGISSSGTPTTNYLPKFTGASTIGDSAISDNGTILSFGRAATFSSSVTADGGASEGSIKIERDTVGTNSVIGSLAFTNNNAATTYGKVFGGRNSAGDGYVALGTGISNNLYALETGNVGIGTSNVAAISTNYGTLNINGTNGGGIICKVNDTSRGYFYSASEGTYIIEAASAPIFMYTGGSERLRIGSNGLVYMPAVYNNTGGGSGTVAISASGELYRATSSLKYKENVIDYNKGLSEVLQLRPVYYNVKREDDNNLYAGLIAEDIEKLGLKEFVQYAEDGTPDAIYYANMISLMTKAIQELSAKVIALENKA